MTTTGDCTPNPFDALCNKSDEDREGAYNEEQSKGARKVIQIVENKVIEIVEQDDDKSEGQIALNENSNLKTMLIVKNYCTIDG